MATRALTIGIDARAADEVPAGRGRVVRELLRELSLRDEPHRYRLYARTAWEEPVDPRFTWGLIDAPDPQWNLRAARQASRDCDAFLSTNSYLTTWFTTIPSVPIVYDLVTFEPEMRPSRRSQLIERATMARLQTSKYTFGLAAVTANYKNKLRLQKLRLRRFF